MTQTPYSKKLEILADVQEYRVASYLTEVKDEWFDFLLNNYLGISLAFFTHHGVVQPTEDEGAVAKNFIDETFTSLLEMFHILEDTGFDSLLAITGEEYL